MEKEQKKEMRNHKPKFKDVPLTEDEKQEAEIKLAQCKRAIDSAELNLKQLDEDEQNKYSERMAVINTRRQLVNIRQQINTELETQKLNQKVYQRQVETGNREEMTSA